LLDLLLAQTRYAVFGGRGGRSSTGAWKSRFMSRAGRTAPVNSTLPAIPVHAAVVVAATPWLYQAIDKIRRSFIWTGDAAESVG
jgi:hypothetical protein